MHLSRLLFKTQKHNPAEAEVASHRLLLRAGFIRRMGAGAYGLTPLACRALRRLEDLVRQRMEGIGGQELLFPVALSMSHDEAATDLAGTMIDSYRQLPVVAYRIQTALHEEGRPRGGLLYPRESLVKTAHSFHAAKDDLQDLFLTVRDTYERIFTELSLPVLTGRSDSENSDDPDAYGFFFLTPHGDDSAVTCPACRYAADQKVARAVKGSADCADEENKLEERHTPGCETIADLCRYLDCTPSQTLKSVFFVADERLVLALIRGDLDVNPHKLSKTLGTEVQTLSAEEAERAGLSVGFTGPVDLRTAAPLLLVADDSVPECGPLVTGANRPDYHLTGVRYGRDFTADIVGDIALSEAGQPCINCGAPLETHRGVEIAGVSRLGSKYSAAMNAMFTDEGGNSHPLLMGSYSMDLTRLLACIVEHSHDEQGIIWPPAIAPYPCHLITVGKKDNVRAAADELYQALGEDSVLFDDRPVSAGIKFMDADLLGMPVRITVGDRSLAAGGAELVCRRTGATKTVPLAEVPEAVAQMLNSSTTDRRD
ncbi:MAG: proline--tRNA ligase [Limnochordia bacterium]|jgi:prolyl-tRNA synthetase